MAFVKRQKKSGHRRTVDLMAQYMYEQCYIGHVPWTYWRKFASFVLKRCKEDYKMGYDAGYLAGRLKEQDARKNVGNKTR